jgi:hypothetical protein
MSVKKLQKTTQPQQQKLQQKKEADPTPSQATPPAIPAPSSFANYVTMPMPPTSSSPILQILHNSCAITRSQREPRNPKTHDEGLCLSSCSSFAWDVRPSFFLWERRGEERRGSAEILLVEISQQQQQLQAFEEIVLGFGGRALMEVALLPLPTSLRAKLFAAGHLTTTTLLFLTPLELARGTYECISPCLSFSLSLFSLFIFFLPTMSIFCCRSTVIKRGSLECSEVGSSIIIIKLL